MYEVPSRGDLRRVVIRPEMVEKGGKSVMGLQPPAAASPERKVEPAPKAQTEPRRESA